MNKDGEFASHDRIDHSRGEYVRQAERLVHTNTVEGYYSIFKRGMRGVYQHCKESICTDTCRSSTSGTATALPLELTMLPAPTSH